MPDHLDGAMRQPQRLAAAGLRREFPEQRRQRTWRSGLPDEIALQRGAGMQAVILPAIHRNHLHVLLDGGNGRQQALAVEAVGIQLFRRLVGGGDHHHVLLEHRLQQAAEQHGVADVVDEQLVEAQHPHLFRQLAGQGAQRVDGAGELEQAAVHPLHEVMEVLAPGGHPQALVEAVHQPGLAPPHRSPEVDAGRLFATVQRQLALLQQRGGVQLRGIGGEAENIHGMPVGGQGRKIGEGTGHRAR
ncbi:hypothetical protein D3C76_1104170 [compost metagenome]